MITGAQNQTMKIHVHDERGKQLFDLDDDTRNLGSYRIHSNMILQVEETNLTRTQMFDDTGDVPKYEITDEEYQTRKNTARHFLQEHKIGKYNPTAQEEQAKKAKETEDREQELAKKININDRSVNIYHRYTCLQKDLTFFSYRCEVVVVSQPTKRGTVLFKGSFER